MKRQEKERLEQRRREEEEPRERARAAAQELRKKEEEARRMEQERLNAAGRKEREAMEDEYAELLESDLNVLHILMKIDSLALDHYQRLKVASDAAPEKIERAYRKVSMRLHPDKVREENKAIATKLFLKLCTAKSVLCSDMGAAYDVELKRGTARSAETEVEREDEEVHFAKADAPEEPKIAITKKGLYRFAFVLLDHGNAGAIIIEWTVVQVLEGGVMVSGVRTLRFIPQFFLGHEMCDVFLLTPNAFHMFLLWHQLQGHVSQSLQLSAQPSRVFWGRCGVADEARC